jgi:hypothetical protein
MACRRRPVFQQLGVAGPDHNLIQGGESMKRIAFLSAAALVICLVAGPAMASNTGFKLNLEMGVGNNFISTPYFYFPNGDINAPEQNAQDACGDLGVPGGGDCELVNITHFTASGPFTATCGSPFQNFVLMAGEGLVVNSSNDCTANIVGSHDDNYTFGRGSSTVPLRTGNTLVSVPYHVVAVNAQDLCTFTNNNWGGGSDLVNVTHFTASGPFTATCGSPFQNFDIVPGEGVFFNTSADMDIQFETY